MSNRTTAYEGEGFKIDLSFEFEYPHIHIKVNGVLNTKRLKRLRWIIREIFYYLDATGVECVLSLAPKEKFVELIVGDCYFKGEKVYVEDAPIKEHTVVIFNLEEVLYASSTIHICGCSSS